MGWSCFRAPIVYTPTVGEACEKYSEVYSGPEGLYLSIDDKVCTIPAQSTSAAKRVLIPIQENLATILAFYRQSTPCTPQIIVVTDGSRILSLGDLGIGGMGISVGKLNLYVAGGGVNPAGTLPVVLE